MVRNLEDTENETVSCRFWLGIQNSLSFFIEMLNEEIIDWIQMDSNFTAI